MAGKHVLNEKPSADTAGETRQMFELAEKRGLVLLDAYHYRCVSICVALAGNASASLTNAMIRFHPALQRVKEIILSKELGKIKNVDVKMELTGGALKPTDIRFNYDLGGGAMMDLGCECSKHT